jgi:predicted HTH domain antitoxin
VASLKVGVKGLEFDMRRFLALQYFKDKRLSMGKAAKLAGMNRFDFMDFLTAEGVVLFDYDESAVEEELGGARRLKGLSR